MPFKSKEQERYLQINEPEIYQDWVEKYGRFKGAESFNAENEKRSKYMNEKRSKYMDYIYDMFYTPDSDAYKLREIRYPKLKGQEHQIASQVRNAFDKRQSPFDSVLHNNLKGLSMTRQPFYYHIPYKGKLFVFSYIVKGMGRLKQGQHTYYPPDSQFGEEQICGLETKHGDECYCWQKNYKSESFGAEGDYEPSFDSLEERIEWMRFAVNDKFLHQYEDDYSNVVLDIEEWNENNGNNSKLSNLVKQYKNKTGWMDAESFNPHVVQKSRKATRFTPSSKLRTGAFRTKEEAQEYRKLLKNKGHGKFGQSLRVVKANKYDPFMETFGKNAKGEYFRDWQAESFSAEDDMIICEGCNMERYSDVDFTIDNAREDVLDDGDVLCDYCWASHDKYVENAESFAAEAIPIRHSRRLNGYYGIKGYEDASEDGFTYRIYRAPGTNDWFRAMVYDDNSLRDNFAKPTSRRLNPSGEMVISNDPASLLIGAFPKLEDAKRALVFRMIQDGNYHQMITDGNLKWLLKDYYAESFSADNYEELITTCPYCEGVKIDDHDKYELVECFKRYLEDSTPHPDKRVMMLKKKAESFSAEECVSCDTPDGYWRGLPLCASSGEELCISCCACNMCRSKWNMLEVGEQKAESFSAERKYQAVDVPLGMVCVLCENDKPATHRIVENGMPFFLCERHWFNYTMGAPNIDVDFSAEGRKAESFGAESYDSALVHLKSLMPINRDSYLRNFHPSELTHSSTNQINFNQASVNYSAEGSRAESFNSYKVAPDLSSYTKAELVSSIAGPQGTAAYDEVVYDPVAQSRLSAESIDSFSPARLIVLGASIGVALGLYNTRRD